MKILIAGAQGQVGSELAAIAQQKHYEVIAATRSELDITNKKMLKHMFLRLNLTFLLMLLPIPL